MIRTKESRSPSKPRCTQHNLIMSGCAPVWMCLDCGAEWEPATERDGVRWYAEFGFKDEPVLSGMLQTLVAAYDAEENQ